MFRVDQEDPGYILTSLLLLFGGVFTLVGYGVGLPSMIGLSGHGLLMTGGLLAGIMTLYEVFSARSVGIKGLKRGYTLLGVWLTLATAVPMLGLWGAIGGVVSMILPFLALTAAALLALEEFKNGKRGILLFTGWMGLNGLFALLGTFGLPFLSPIMAILAIAAGYFLIQDK